MAYRNNKAEILIEFKQVGIKGIEDVIKGLDNELLNLKKVIEGLELKPSFVKRFNVLNEQIKLINNQINNFKEKVRVLQDTKVSPKDLDKVRKDLFDITRLVGNVSSDYEVLKQALGQTEKGVKALAQANLENLKTYTRSKTLIKDLSKEYENLLKIKDKSERIGNIVLFNKALEDRINALKFYKTKLNEIKSLKLESNLEKELIKPLDSFRKAVQDAKYPVDKLNEKLAKLENQYKIFGDLVEKRKALVSKLFDLRLLGKSEEEIKKLQKQIDELFLKGIELKDTNVFEGLITDISKFEVEAQKAFKNAQKYSNLYIQALENLHKASKLPFIDSTKLTQYQNEVKKLYDMAVQTGNAKPLAILNKEIRQLVNNSNALVKASDTFQRLNNELKKLGADKVILKKFEKEFTKLAEEAKGTGNTTYLGLLFKDMRQLAKETKNLSNVEKKLRLLKETLSVLKGYGLPKDTIRKLTEEFEVLEKKVKATGDVSALNDFNKKLNEIVNSSKNLREVLFADNKAFNKFMSEINNYNPKEIKLFEGLYKDANKFIKELNNLKNRYRKIIQNLQVQISSRKEFASEKDLKKAIALVEQYEQRLNLLTKAEEQLKFTMRSGTLNIDVFKNIRKSADNAINELKNLDIVLTSLKAKLQETSFSKFLKHITKMAIGYSALYMSIYEVINVIQRGFGFIVQMNEAIGKMSAVFDISASKAKQLEERLVRLGVAYGGDIKAINEVAMALGRAGVESDKLLKVTEYVIKMSKLTGDQFETTANALITYIHNYNKAGVSIKQLADELTYVANASKLSTEDINVFSNYALATAKSANLTRHFIEALAIAFSNAGFEASTIGTSIRRLGTILQDNSGAVQQFFRSLGISQKLFAQQVSKSAKDSERMMVWLVKRLKDMSDQEFQEAIGNMEILARQTLSAMRNNASEVLKHLQILNKGVQGELDKSNVMLDTYINQWERLKNSLGLAFSGLMENAMPVISQFMNKLIGWLNAINNAMPQIQKDLESIWGILKGISSILAGFLAFKGLKWISSVFKEAKIAGGGFLGVLKQVGTALETIALLAIRNPYVMLAVGAIAVFGKLFFTIKNVNDELVRSNGLLAQQQKLNSLVSQYDTLIAKKQQLKKQLAEALVANDQKRVKQLIYQLNKIEEQLEMYKKLVEEQEKIVKQKQDEIDKAQKYIEYQLLSAKLERLKAEYTKNNTKELENQIKTIEQQLEKLKQFENYKPKINNQKSISVFQPVTPETKSVINVKGNITWESNLDNLVVESKKLQDEVEKIKISMNTFDLTSNPFEVLNSKLNEFKTKFKKDINNLKEETKTGIIKIVSDEEVARFNQIAEKIKFFVNQGLDVKGLADNLVKQIDESFKDTMRGLVKSMEISFKNAKIDFNVLPNGLGDELERFKTMLANATNPKDTVRLEAEFLKLKLLLDSMKDSLDKNTYQALKAYLEGLDKDFANLENLLKARVSAINALHPKLSQKPLPVKPQDYQIKDIYNLKDFGEIIYEINKLTNVYVKALQDMKKVGATGRLPIVNEILELQKEIKRSDEMYQKFYNQRVAKENEYYQVVSKIKSLREKGYKNEEQRTKLLAKKKQLESEIKGLYQKEESFKKKTLQLEIKEIQLKQKLLATEFQLNREAKAMNDKGYALKLELLNKMYETQKKLQIVSFDWENDKAKIDTYFNYLNAYIKTKEEELKNAKMTITENAFSGMNIDPYTNNFINAYKNYQQQLQAIKNFYAQKKALIQAKELELQQALQAGKINEVEYTRRMERLKTEAVKAEIERRKQLELNSLNTSLSMMSSYLGAFGDAMGQMMQQGLIKQKRWMGVYKAIRVAQAVIDTYASAQKAMAELPYPLNYVASGLAIATGMARVAVIKAQRFHTGGYVDRQTANQKMGGLKDDEIPAILQKGEYVLSKEEVKAIKASGNVNPQVNVTAPTPEVVIINSVDPKAFEEYLTSRNGREVIKNIVGR